MRPLTWHQQVLILWLISFVQLNSLLLDTHMKFLIALKMVLMIFIEAFGVIILFFWKTYFLFLLFHSSLLLLKIRTPENRPQFVVRAENNDFIFPATLGEVSAAVIWMPARHFLIAL